MNLQRSILLVLLSLLVVAGGALVVALADDAPVTPTTTTAPEPTGSPTTPAPTSTTGGPTDSTVPPSSTSTTVTTTTTAPPSTTQPPSAEQTLELSSVSELGEVWQEIFVIPYGPEDHQLGTSLGGDGAGFQLGPDYGAQAPDGTWWFLDAAKKRLAHFSESGEYLDAIAMKPEHLINGEYFQFQLPRMLNDGRLVAARLGGTTTLLILEDGDTRTVAVPADFRLRTDDGESLYGFGPDGRTAIEVDPESGTPEPVEWFRTRAGSRYRVGIAGDLLTVELPDAATPHLAFRLVYAGDPSVPAFGMVEVASGEDGSLFLYLIGGTDTGVGGQLAGFLSISPDGVATPIEPSRNPFSNADPGSPAHLGTRPGTSTPWLMFIDPDGVRVFARTPPLGAQG